MQLSVKRTILYSFALVFLLSLLVSATLFYQLNQIQDIQERQLLLTDAKESLNDYNFNFLRFINYGYKSRAFHENDNDSTIQHLQKSIVSAIYHLTELNQKGGNNGLGIKKFEKLKETGYAVATAYKTRGFQDFGLEGKMRESVHKLEDTEDPTEKVFILTLRRHEKDFFMRKDEKYILRLKNTASDYTDYLLNNSDKFSAERQEVIENYVNDFLAIASIEEKIGYTSNEGLIGNFSETFLALKPLVDEQAIYLANEQAKARQLSLISFPVFLIALLVAMLFIFQILSRKVFKPISILTTEMEKAENNIQDSNLNTLRTGNDEIGVLSKAFKSLIIQLKDMLAETASKNEKLEAANRKSEERSWINTGLSKLSELIKTDEDVETICNAVTSFLVKYTDCAVGAIYLKEDYDEDVNTSDLGLEAFKNKALQLKGAYAYGRKKHVNVTILPKEGLIGQCWVEGKPIFMTDIPKDFTSIKSGLGGATPTCVFICPVIDDENVLGVVELQSFNSLEDHKQSFVIQFLDRFARNVSSIMMQEQTKKLLQESEMMAEQMRSAEEELKQNLEELQATQEELERSKQAQQNEIERLKEELRRAKQTSLN